MKTTLILPVLSALFLAAAPKMAMADTFFNDTFTTSTLNQVPGTPTPTSASYQTYQGTAGGSEAISANNLTLTFTNTSELCEFVGLFTNTPIALTQTGDFMNLTVVFVNKSNILSGTATANSSLNIGLFNSGGAAPNQGNLVLSAGSTTGGTEGWQGYVGRLIFSGTAAIFTRPVQTGNTGPVTSQNQDLMFDNASSSQAFNLPRATSLGNTPASAPLSQGATYTEHLSINLTTAGSLVISNILYVGAGTGGTAQFTNVQTATNATFITAGFNGMAIGWRNSSSASQASCMSISSINVSGHATAITTPPTINTQPIPVQVPNGASGAFSVAATGFNVVYQWHRNGTNLLDGGNISGSTSPILAISPAGPADVLSGANGYYVTVTGAGNYSTNSVTNSLSFINATNLVWNDSVPNNNWDLNTTANWQDTNGNTGFLFNFGDPVTFDDNGGGGFVNLVGSYLSPASVTVNSSSGYVFQGTGSLAGPCTMVYKGTGRLTLNNVNTFTGGTIISNASANLLLQNLAGLGNGPVTFAKAGGLMEIAVAASGSTQINGDIITADDASIQVDGVGTFAAVFFGNFSGNVGKTLTFNPKDLTTTNRIRIYGNGMTNNANIVLNGPATTQANYFGTALAGYEPSGIQLYNGVISGNGGFIQRGSGMTILAGANTYTGGTTPSSGAIGFGIDNAIGTGALLLAPEAPNATASGTVLAIGGAHTITNAVQYPSGTNNLTLIVGGTNNLTFSGPMPLNGLDGLTASGITARTITVTNSGATTISGIISDASSTFSLMKNGVGALYLNGANTYTSPTTNSAGLLAGSGSLNGSLWVNTTNASIGGGSAASIGTLTVAGNLTMSGNGFFRVNHTGLASDKVSVTGTINNTGTTGTIVVTNVGSTLVVGDRFVLFNKLVTGGANFAVTGGGVNWTDNLGSDGSITVQSIIVPSAPPLTNKVSGGVLTLSWPVANLGWHIEIQTNLLSTGLNNNNWIPSTGTTSVTSTNYPVDPKNGTVFYRLAAPGF